LGGRRVTAVRVHEPRLRRPVPRALGRLLGGQRLEGVRRRAKYLLFDFANGTALIHLGMSGSLRVVPAASPLAPHDHVEIEFGPRHCLRLRDPRRFGLVLWAGREPEAHELLQHLGPEPFDEAFSADYLRALAAGRRAPVKNFIMDARVVVGVGNIYASEALFRAGIHPSRAAGRIGHARHAALVDHIRTILGEAIEAGGTTLRDFVRNDGEPGYFRYNLKVYGRAGEPCVSCGHPITVRVIGQRSSFFCSRCQR
ncbi:MAG: bifunctional DNA-formamidopyrimidine glycosylase/DNA-(apurinic or apyrimidinic site) lyase, partial [Gammaproteobacteria bacterium]